MVVDVFGQVANYSLPIFTTVGGRYVDGSILDLSATVSRMAAEWYFRQNAPYTQRRYARASLRVYIIVCNGCVSGS